MLISTADTIVAHIANVSLRSSVISFSKWDLMAQSVEKNFQVLLFIPSNDVQNQSILSIYFIFFRMTMTSMV